MKIAALLPAVLVICGCVSSGTKVTSDQLSQFHKGTTTEPDVIRALGKPQTISIQDDGSRTISYVGSHASPKASSFIPIYGALAGGANSSITVVTMRFGPDGKLVELTSSQTETDLKTGLVR